VNNAANVNAESVTTNNLNGAAFGDLSGVSNEQIVVYDTTNQEFRPKAMTAGTNTYVVATSGSLTINNTLSSPTVTFSSGTITYERMFKEFTLEGTSTQPLTQTWYGIIINSGGTRYATIHVNRSNLVTSFGGGSDGIWSNSTSPFGSAFAISPSSSVVSFHGIFNKNYNNTDPENSGVTQHFEGSFGGSTRFGIFSASVSGRSAMRSNTDEYDDTSVLVKNGFSIGPYTCQG